MLSAYLLVSHGSRDPRPEIAIKQLTELVCKKVQSNLLGTSYNQTPAISGVNLPLRCETLIGTACLELSAEPLHEQIKNFGKHACACGCDRLKILPLFLLPGVHVMEDIPAEVALAQQALGKDIIIDLQPYLGSNPDLGRLLANQIAAKAQASILLAHGSRRPGSQESTEAIAANLGAVAAYWAVPPSLESRVRELVFAGYKQITIMPYFLFHGGITDAIAQSTEELKLQFPAVSFQLAEPLGASAELADLIWDLIAE